MIVDCDFREICYKCKKPVMRYLIYEKHFPLFSFDKDFYYFARGPDLEKALEEMPLYLKLVSGYFLSERR